jgi:23S rRNA pseudouridine2605 synthase
MSDDHKMPAPEKSAPKKPNEATFPEDGERIAKRIARAGICSRRDAERMIEDRRVGVNGTLLDSPACVVTARDRITVDGVALPEKEPTRLWRYHKPAGLVTTHRDPEGRPTLFEKLPDDMPRVISVGRLDLTSEGLLLLTNDGELARRLELPSTGWIRRYRVRVNGDVDEAGLAGLANGVTVEGVRYGPIDAVLEKRQGLANAWLTVSITEGKNREIRRVMSYLGYRVNRLIRIAYGPFQLGYLPEGAVEEIPTRSLREQLARNETTPRVPQPLSPSPAIIVRKRAERRVEEVPYDERPRDDRTGGMNWEEKKKAMAKAAAARGSAARSGAKTGGKPSVGKPAARSTPSGGKPGPRRTPGRDR